jgi:hypothetical protein
VSVTVQPAPGARQSAPVGEPMGRFRPVPKGSVDAQPLDGDGDEVTESEAVRLAETLREAVMLRETLRLPVTEGDQERLAPKEGDGDAVGDVEGEMLWLAVKLPETLDEPIGEGVSLGEGPNDALPLNEMLNVREGDADRERLTLEPEVALALTEGDAERERLMLAVELALTLAPLEMVRLGERLADALASCGCAGADAATTCLLAAEAWDDGGAQPALLAAADFYPAPLRSITTMRDPGLAVADVQPTPGVPGGFAVTLTAQHLPAAGVWVESLLCCGRWSDNDFVMLDSPHTLTYAPGADARGWAHTPPPGAETEVTAGQFAASLAVWSLLDMAGYEAAVPVHERPR